MSNLAGSDIIDPLSNFAVSGSCDRGFPGWSCDPGLEQLRRDFAIETGEEARKALAARIQQRALENVSYLPLGQYTVPAAHRSAVSGILAAPVPVYWNIQRK